MLTGAVFLAAALLIQGSACVYSKKVEHLHGLVHQALSVISDKRWALLSAIKVDIVPASTSAY